VIIALIIIAVFIGIVIGIINAAKQGVRDSKELKQNTEAYSPSQTARMKHISGLPLPSGITVDVAYCDDKIVFVKESQNYVIRKENISYMEAMDGKTLQGQAADAAAGMLLFGVAGAALGALSSTSTYLVIAFESNGEAKNIVLDCNNNIPFVRSVLKEYQREKTNRPPETIEL
jgi:hypothetical protein